MNTKRLIEIAVGVLLGLTIYDLGVRDFVMALKNDNNNSNAAVSPK